MPEALPVPTGAHLVVGTAGHIDHGKTSLVKLLTGVDLDTLPEEKERQITIALGFTHLDLPSGRVAALVDVPGHERFVRTMVAGAQGLDAAMLVVSATEGARPQTLEHLHILGLLGVDQALVALTFRDLVDDELLELAALEIREILSATRLAGAAIIPVSNVTGEGREAILAAIDGFQARPRDLDGPFRLPVDRVFTRHGHGTVATGTVISGRVHDGEELVLVPGDQKVRVRGIQVHGQRVSESMAGLRTALNLAASKDAVSRGQQVVDAGTVPSPRVIDVSYHHIAGAPPLDDQDEVRFLVGTADVVARLRLLGIARIPPEGQEKHAWEGFLQLHLHEPVACLPGDRYVLRRLSPTETLGGGAILDPWATPTRRRDGPDAIALLDRLARGERDVILYRAGRPGIPPDEARTRGVSGVVLGDRVVHARHVTEMEALVEKVLSEFHATHPFAAGASRAEIQGAAVVAVEGGRSQAPFRRSSERSLEALLGRCVEAGRILRTPAGFRLASFRAELSPSQAQARDRILAAARDAGLAALETRVLVAVSGVPDGEKIVHFLATEGRLVHVAPFHVVREAADRFVLDVKAWLAKEGTLTPAQAKELTGLTRKHLIPFLEWLDATQVTRRVGDSRRAWK
jgi:selenocysteine-specific elongation factor